VAGVLLEKMGVHDDRGRFRRALEISLLLHLVLIFLLAPRLREVWSASDEAAARLMPAVQPSEQRPLEFEFVDLAQDREETPRDESVPLSDLDRRAHGGEGEAADRPATQGSTPQLVQSEGSQIPERGAPPQVPAPAQQQAPPEQQQPNQSTEDRNPPVTVEPEGTGQRRQEETAPQQPRIQLPPSGAYVLPPSYGGPNENPDRDGGQVDTGTLSFDTQWYDWGPYAKRMLARIRREWYARMPDIARLGVPGVVRIRFFIERNGEVTGLQITSESGKPPMDLAARDAIAASSAFDPLPSDLTGIEREGVTITFFYNSRP